MALIDVYLNIPLSDVKEAAVHQWPVNGRKANSIHSPKALILQPLESRVSLLM